ncbi:MAG: LLM class flavin-dependent oxidoreductase [Dehalococcoidia bacterium]|nr:LLM class flavin-dependent oxidoreductase [Dehalococcoidia bacterium]
MKFGQLHLFERPAGRTEQQVIDEQFDIMLRSEDYGFDSVWPAEHHFREYGHCATPSLILAALATRTTRLRLGTGVVVLPLNHPVRIAEDYAFLDVLSNGRIDLGLGRGYQPHEYRGYGVDQSRSRDIFREGVEIIQKAWTEESFSYQGEYYQFEDLSVHPKPVQQPHPPIWMASLSAETFEMCGRYGFNLLCAPVFGFNLETGAAQIQEYRNGLKAHGRNPSDYKVAALSMTYVADTTQQALDEFKDGVMWYMKTFQKYVAPPKGQAPIPTFELYTQIRDILDLAEWDRLVAAGAVICGSPDEVVDRIGHFAETCGIDEYLAWTRIGGLDRDKVMRCMELMGSKVMPQLRGMGVAAS